MTKSVQKWYYTRYLLADVNCLHKELRSKTNTFKVIDNMVNVNEKLGFELQHIQKGVGNYWSSFPYKPFKIPGISLWGSTENNSRF